MKKVLVLLFCFLSVQIHAQRFSLIGKWKVTEQKESGFFIFGSDSSISLADDKGMVQPAPEINGKATIAVFFADTMHQPFQLDMIMKDASTGEVISRMKGIYKILSIDKMMVRFSDEDTRPKNFLPKGNDETIIFIRVL